MVTPATTEDPIADISACEKVFERPSQLDVSSCLRHGNPALKLLVHCADISACEPVFAWPPQSDVLHMLREDFELKFNPVADVPTTPEDIDDLLDSVEVDAEEFISIRWKSIAKRILRKTRPNAMHEVKLQAMNERWQEELERGLLQLRLELAALRQQPPPGDVTA